MNALDFSTDNDHEPDSNGEYTSAILEAGPLPGSLTICSAFMVERWTFETAGANMFTLRNKNLGNLGEPWGTLGNLGEPWGTLGNLKKPWGTLGTGLQMQQRR